MVRSTFPPAPGDGQRDGRRVRASVRLPGASWIDESSSRRASSPRSPPSVLGDTTLARAQAPALRRLRPTAQHQPRRLIMDAYTRHLHWIRSADEIAEAAIEMTCGGVNPTIQEYPGHIDPAKVATELPAFVKTMQKHGLRVKQIRGGNQTDVERAACRGHRRHDGPARRHALLDGHGQLRFEQADPAAARRDQAEGRAVRQAQSEARHDADVSHARRRQLGRRPSCGICST